MAPRLYAHIGTPKTGSSSLQRALHDGAYSTGGVRVAYPDRLSEVDLAQAMVRDRERRVARRLRHLRDWLATTEAEVFVLSSEHFLRVPASVFASAVGRDLPDWSTRLHAVCYVRPHGPRLLSAFAQQRKSGAFLGSMETFLQKFERSGLRYAKRLAAWQDTYGDRLVVREMSSTGLLRGDVVADFLHLVTAGDSVVVHGQRRNVSLTVEALALLKIIHRALRARGVPADIAHRVGKQISADLNAAEVADRGHQLWLSRSEAQAVAAMFAEDAAQLDALFFPSARPFTEGLRTTTVKAPSEAPDLRPSSHADRDSRAAIRRDAEALAVTCLEHGRPWVSQFRAAKGYRSSRGPGRPGSAERVGAALAAVVSSLTAALRHLPRTSTR